jgi:hypothetical protein
MYLVLNGWVGSSPSFSGTVYFRPGCVIKYMHDSGFAPPCMLLYGGILCNGTWAWPSILTSAGDNQYGDRLSGGGPDPTSNPPGTALWLYQLINTNMTVKGLCVRYAVTAMQCGSTPCGSGLGAGALGVARPLSVPATATVTECALYACQNGILADGRHVVLQNSAALYVTNPIVTECGGWVTGGFTNGSPPPSASPPSCPTVLLGSDVTVSESVSPPTVVDWYLSTYVGNPVYGFVPTLVGTGTNFTLSGTQLLTQYGVSNVFVGMFNQFGSNYNPAAYIVVADQCGIDALNHFLANTNGKTSSLWTSIPATDPPTGMAWNPNSLVHGMTGFTAISQMNNWDLYPCSCPGQVPVTALTSRHGYTRGHGMGFDDVVGGGEIDRRGTRVPVWFCTANNQLVEADVQLQYTRKYTTNGITYDYTVFIFDRDLVPLGITPMRVGSPPPCSTVFFRTTQHALGTVPGSVAALGPSFQCVTTPFNDFPSGMTVPGDSGSPQMLPAADNFLVFLNGVGTTGPCDLMQQDMNTLTGQLNLNTNDYQMVWHSTHY